MRDKAAEIQNGCLYPIATQEFDILFHTGRDRSIAPTKELISRIETVAPDNSDLRKIDICEVNIGNMFSRTFFVWNIYFIDPTFLYFASRISISSKTCYFL